MMVMAKENKENLGTDVHSQLTIETHLPNDGNVTCCRTLRMPICYKAEAKGQSLIDGQEVRKVKLSSEI